MSALRRRLLTLYVYANIMNSLVMALYAAVKGTLF